MQSSVGNSFRALILPILQHSHGQKYAHTTRLLNTLYIAGINPSLTYTQAMNMSAMPGSVIQLKH